MISTVRLDLPSGTVTFLFTDVEGSTRLLHELGQERYADALAQHRHVVRKACRSEGGVEVDTQGDAFFFAFPEAQGAINAAYAFTESLASGPISVRVGLHTGAPLLTEEGYVGDDVHFAARVASSAHGGQVILSKATAELIELELTDLGEHRLKDIEEAVAIYQLGDGSFPPLKTISNTNLPRPASSFVGRRRELDEVLDRLEHGARLVTLTGAGGSGKTRLAIEAASSLVPLYKAGVFWVGLASLRDPALVTETMAQMLGAKDGLLEHIGERELLLLLDNLEQVIEAAPALAELLRACPNLTLLVTSRELLRVQGEVEYPVPPLAEAEAVSLFCERSQLEATEEISELCARLDSLPLAVELAAARANALSPAQILERLSSRLDLLKGGRDADPRQQTLRATIEWSYDLLSPEEQRHFARLSVFAGGCTLEAAEQVAGADLDTLQSLVEKSLLRFTSERYWMLETIREYAGELLDAREEDELRARHADHFALLAETAEPYLLGEDEHSWITRLDFEHDNFRGALSWALRRRDGQRALRLCGDLHALWYVRDHMREGREWAEQALALSSRPSVARERTLGTAGEFALMQGDLARARTLLQEHLELCRALADSATLPFALTLFGHVLLGEGDYSAARDLYEESRLLTLDGRPSGAWGPTPAISLNNIGWAKVLEGDFVGAREVLTEGLACARSEGSGRLESTVLNSLAAALLEMGELDEARARLTESFRILTIVSNVRLLVEGLDLLACVEVGESRMLRAAKLHGAAKTLRESAGIELEPATGDYASVVSAAVDAADWRPAVAEGSAMTPEEALAYALADLD